MTIVLEKERITRKSPFNVLQFLTDDHPNGFADVVFE